MSLRIVVIGLQHFHVFGIISRLKATEGVKIVALAETEAPLREEMARKYGIPAYADYQEMLARERPEAAIVSTINNEKADAIVACARAGVHVVVDKPLCTEPSQLEEIDQTLRAHPVHLSMLVAGGYGGGSHALRQVIREHLGDVVQLNSTSTHRWQIDPQLGARPAWNYSRKAYGGAIVVDGIHGLNNLRWLTGRDVIAISAVHSNRTMPEHPEFEDNFAILVELDGGCSATLSFAWLTPKGEPTHGRSSMTILGTKGLLEIRSVVAEHPRPGTASLEEGVVQSAASETILTTMLRPAEKIALPAAQAPSLEEDFVASIENPSYQPTLSPDWLIESTRLTLLARQAADEHRMVRIR